MSGAVGQLFFFYTIKKFGPVVFTLMMSTRQMISMVGTSLILGHRLAALPALSAVFTLAMLAVFTHKSRRETNTRRRGISGELEELKDLP